MALPRHQTLSCPDDVQAAEPAWILVFHRARYRLGKRSNTERSNISANLMTAPRYNRIGS